MYIQNQSELTRRGDVHLRKELIDAAEAALASVDPYLRTKQVVKLRESILSVDGVSFDLSRTGRVCVLGAGKATYPIAKALEEILGPYISDGLIIVKDDETRSLSKVNVARAGHPLPNEAGYRAAQDIVQLASNSEADDLFLVAFTGGCSALMPCPVAGVTLEEKRRITSLLLACGATIREINSVRKHLSRTKGGGLAKMLAPATIVNLTVSDVIGDPLDCITDPTVIDSSTFEDAKRTLVKYDLLDLIPSSARDHLARGSASDETLKEYGNLRVYTFILANNVMAAEAASSTLKLRGFNSMVLTTSLQGESREVGYALAAIIEETVRYNRPASRPVAYVCAGETVVRLDGESNGLGGPSQELALAMSMRFPSNSHVAAIAFDTDGSDGPTNIAGAIVDSETVARSEELDADLDLHLKRHDVLTVLGNLGDAVRTGATGTNVMDLVIMIVEN